MNFFKKNILVVTVATGLLVIGGIVLFLNFSSETSYKTKTFGQSPSQPYVPSFSPSVPPEESGEGWYQGDSATYTIGFPPAWTPRVTTVEGGGEEAVFM